MVASVPEETKRTASIGVRRTISSASSTSGTVGVPYDVPRATASATAACTSGWAWPTSIGPQEQIRSTYSLPSTSVSQAPRAEAMKRGVPPTASNARTGEFTPPGVTARARPKSSSDRPVGRSRTGSVRGRSPLHSRRPGQADAHRQEHRRNGCDPDNFGARWRCSSSREAGTARLDRRGTTLPRRNPRGVRLVGPVPACEGEHRRYDEKRMAEQWGETSNDDRSAIRQGPEGDDPGPAGAVVRRLDRQPRGRRRRHREHRGRRVEDAAGRDVAPDRGRRGPRQLQRPHHAGPGHHLRQDRPDRADLLHQRHPLGRASRRTSGPRPSSTPPTRAATSPGS